MMSFRNAACVFVTTMVVSPTSVIGTPISTVTPVNTVSSTVPSAEELVPAFEAFRSLLGGENNNNNPFSSEEGHRQINWDADIVPFDMPGDFFAATVTRGLTLQTPDGTGEFRVSNPPQLSGIGDDKFDSIVGSLASQFQQFSPLRLFAPLEENEVIVKFVDAGNIGTPAAVTGFGAVFTGVTFAEETKMEFFDADGCLLAEEYVQPSENGGLSFLGLDFGDNPIVVSVHITLGGASILESGGEESSDNKDVVVMDDFLYGEPQPIILPAEPACTTKKSAKKAGKKKGKGKGRRSLLSDGNDVNDSDVRKRSSVRGA
jgi:hypothetical protein